MLLCLCLFVAYHEEEGHIFWIDRNVIRVVTDTGRGAIDVINQGRYYTTKAYPIA